MRIVIETIDHASQAYPTTGNWTVTEYPAKEKSDRHGPPIAADFALHIEVSKMGDWRYEALVGIHEAVEAILCREAGVSEQSVNAFDIEFENAREKRLGAWFTFRGRNVDADAEPGDDEDAPYRRQHCFATAVERMLAAEMGVSWTAYDKANLDLYEADA